LSPTHNLNVFCGSSPSLIRKYYI